MILFGRKTIPLLIYVFTLLCTTQSQPVQPVLEFPDPILDDPDAYRGYVTRFYRDGRENTVQVYMHRSHGRVVHIWGNAANESIGFTVRDMNGNPESLQWESGHAFREERDGMRILRHTLRSESSQFSIGLFLLGSMRKEREYQYRQKHLLEFGSEQEFTEPEISKFLDLITRLPDDDLQRIFSVLDAESVDELQKRTHPTITKENHTSVTTVSVLQFSFDNKNRLLLEFRVDRSDAAVDLSPSALTFRSRRNEPVTIELIIGTDASPLTPLRKEEIFNDEFRRFFEETGTRHSRLKVLDEESPGSVPAEALHRFMWLDRQVKSVELLSSEEKLMAGLPNFATYFGRDMLMSGLMMEPIWNVSMLEYVVTSVLKKLTHHGDVSHEEALGGQAIRENLGRCNSLLLPYIESRPGVLDPGYPDTFAEIITIVSNLREPVENYIMVDDNLQLPVLTARYLTRPDVAMERKREFLNKEIGWKGGVDKRLTLLLKNLHLVATLTKEYVVEPVAENLVSFPQIGNDRWYPGSWRDSDAGYAGGRFAMDVNAIWAPNALLSTAHILDVLKELDITSVMLESLVPELSESELISYFHDPVLLQRSIEQWSRAEMHFDVRYSQEEVYEKVLGKIEWMSPDERDIWRRHISGSVPPRGIEFSALSLDHAGSPIPVMHTDFATMIFLENLIPRLASGHYPFERFAKQIETFLLPYPVGLFIENVGPVVANDAYTSSRLWENFKNDDYHSPTTIWGRDVNLFLLGLAKNMLSAREYIRAHPGSETVTHAFEIMQHAFWKILNAVDASGLKHNELWSYRVGNETVLPVRYPTTSDIQLWNLTELVVQYYLEMIGPSND